MVTRIVTAALIAALMGGCTAQNGASPDNEALILNGASTLGFIAGRAGAVLIAEKGKPGDLELVGGVVNSVNAILRGEQVSNVALNTELAKLPYGMGADVQFVLARWAPVLTDMIDRDSQAYRITVSVLDGFEMAFGGSTGRAASFVATTGEPLPETVAELRALIRR